MDHVELKGIALCFQLPGSLPIKNLDTYECLSSGSQGFHNQGII
jgi:hypothetical protein